MIVALAAPLLAPPVNTRNPYAIPRDGFSNTPKPPRNGLEACDPRRCPSGTGFTGQTEDGCIFMGTASGSWDIFYGVVWGARTALKVGVIIEGMTLLIGILVGSLSAFYGGWTR